MPRDPLAWLPLLRHWTHCLGEGPEAIAAMGDLAALPELNMAALLPGGPGWTDLQRSLRHDPEAAFRLLYYGLALRGLEAVHIHQLPATALRRWRGTSCCCTATCWRGRRCGAPLVRPANPATNAG